MAAERNGVSRALFGIIMSVLLGLTAALWQSTDAKADRADFRSIETSKDVTRNTNDISHIMKQLDRIEAKVDDLRKRR